MEKNNKKSQTKYLHRASLKAQKKRIRQTAITICLLLVFAAGFLAFRTIHLNQQKAEYKAQIELLEQDIAKEEEQTELLKQKKVEVTSDSYIESEARKRLGLVYEDEIIIKRKN